MKFTLDMTVTTIISQFNNNMKEVVVVHLVCIFKKYFNINNIILYIFNQQSITFAFFTESTKQKTSKIFQEKSLPFFPSTRVKAGPSILKPTGIAPWSSTYGYCYECTAQLDRHRLPNACLWRGIDNGADIFTTSWEHCLHLWITGRAFGQTSKVVKSDFGKTVATTQYQQHQCLLQV
jgi:hypothetical protein